MDHGTHVRSLILKMDALQRKHFDEAVSSFLRSFTKYLLNNLPLTIRLLNMQNFFNHHCNKALLHQMP